MEAKRQAHLGTILLDSSVYSWGLTSAVLIFAAAVLAVLILGTYTRRTTVQGYLIPVGGVLRVYSPSAGRVAAVHVTEGQEVKAGDKLITVADERQREAGDEARRSVLRQIEARKSSLQGSVDQQRALFKQSTEGLNRRIDALVQELGQLGREHQMQQSRVTYAQATEARYRELATKNFVSANSAQEKAELVIEHQARLQGIERMQTSVLRDIATLKSELASLPMREQAQLSELERSLAAVEQELIEGEVRRELAITAPQPGRVSAVAVQPGYVASMDRPLLTIVPAKNGTSAQLEAHLFAQSKDVGFVRAGQEVLIRYGAYPFQKFGHYKGKVAEVTNTPLSQGELVYAVGPKAEPPSLLGGVPMALSRQSTAEPLFRIRVVLDRQSAQAYGQSQPLQPGMQLEADVMLDRRTLVEWIFEPLFSLRGKFWA